jgi:hypothetical protein
MRRVVCRIVRTPRLGGDGIVLHYIMDDYFTSNDGASSSDLTIVFPLVTRSSYRLNSSTTTGVAGRGGSGATSRLISGFPTVGSVRGTSVPCDDSRFAARLMKTGCDSFEFGDFVPLAVLGGGSGGENGCCECEGGRGIDSVKRSKTSLSRTLKLPSLLNAVLKVGENVHCCTSSSIFC